MPLHKDTSHLACTDLLT